MADELPPSITSGQLAKVVKTSERSIAGRKADGRLPVFPNGKIDLYALIGAGVASMARSRNDSKASGEFGSTFDTGMRAAAKVTAHIVVRRIVEAGPGADVNAVAAEALAEALQLFSWE
jgi:hypothetical protein